MVIVSYYRLLDGLRPDVAGEKEDIGSTLGRLPDTTSYHLLEDGLAPGRRHRPECCTVYGTSSTRHRVAPRNSLRKHPLLTADIWPMDARSFCAVLCAPLVWSSCIGNRLAIDHAPRSAVLYTVYGVRANPWHGTHTIYVLSLLNRSVLYTSRLVYGLPHREIMYLYKPPHGRIVIAAILDYVEYTCAENRYRQDVGILVPNPLTPLLTFPFHLGSAKRQAPSYRNHLPNHAIPCNADRQDNLTARAPPSSFFNGLPHSAWESLGVIVCSCWRWRRSAT